MMKIAFVRTVGQPDRFYVRRDDGSEASWSFPTYGDALPHDLVHYVVECAFGLNDGFWGRVAAGADVGRINASANRAGGKDKYAGFGPDRSGILLAEALAATKWSGDVEACRASVADAAATIGIAVPDIDATRAARVRAALAHAEVRWKALVPKGAIDVVFDSQNPERGLEGL